MRKKRTVKRLGQPLVKGTRWDAGSFYRHRPESTGSSKSLYPTGWSAARIVASARRVETDNAHAADPPDAKDPTDVFGKTTLVRGWVDALRGAQREEKRQAQLRKGRQDPTIDARTVVDGSRRAARLMGVTSGKRVTTGTKAPLNITRRPGRPRSKALTAAPLNRVEAQALDARRADWNARERPARITPKQWEALRLREVEGAGVPGHYKRMTFIRVGQRLVPPISGPKAKNLVDKANAKLGTGG